MNSDLASLFKVLAEYRDLGLAATSFLEDGDVDTADQVLGQRTDIFASFQKLEADLAASDHGWNNMPEFKALGQEIQQVDQRLAIALKASLDELARDMGRLGEVKRTLKGYRSGETGDTLFTRMA